MAVRPSRIPMSVDRSFRKLLRVSGAVIFLILFLMAHASITNVVLATAAGYVAGMFIAWWLCRRPRVLNHWSWVTEPIRRDAKLQSIINCVNLVVIALLVGLLVLCLTGVIRLPHIT